MNAPENSFGRFVVASGSARRHHLLRGAGVTFDIVVPHVDETPLAGEAPTAMVARLAEAKSTAVSSGRRVVVLGCDTTVALDGRPLGKPGDETEALAMLLALSARPHTVITAFCLSSAGTPLAAEAVTTRVVMRPFDTAAAAAYVATGEPFGKAGAYAIQGGGGRLVDHIEGSYTNVMGLPLDAVLPHVARLVPGSIRPIG